MSKARLSRREREKIRHKEEILEIALRLFSDKGFHNVSMLEIAEKSEFGVGTLYKFFEGKEALFEELINSTGEQALNEFSEVLDGPGNEAKRLSGFFKYQPELQQKHGEVIKLFIYELGIKGMKVSEISEQNRVHKILNSKIAHLIQSGIKKGLFRTVDPEITAKAIVSAVETLIFETVGNTDKTKAAEMFQKLDQLFLGSLLKPEVCSNG